MTAKQKLGVRDERSRDGRDEKFVDLDGLVDWRADGAAASAGRKLRIAATNFSGVVLATLFGRVLFSGVVSAAFVFSKVAFIRIEESWQMLVTDDSSGC
ncbi:MAG TPA: hypothetical protein VHA06_21160 [Candidatus Angelobacter sp.]|jgi:hypothetical protein|nr:hypothetical protein [Candidatus Angelobacter sp.]